MPNRRQQVSDLYYAALDREEDQRAAFLATCPDLDLRREVELLLAEDKDAAHLPSARTRNRIAPTISGISPSSLTGRRLGSYEVGPLLGVGGMGEVYRARDAKLQREVALKFLPEAFSEDPDRQTRFQREARLLAALNHPNIAAIHGLEEFDGRHCLILELVDGKTLHEILADGPMPVADVLDVAAQMAAGLAAAHEAGVVHRDLKPQNVMVRGDGLVKILDFGLGKLGGFIEPSGTDTLSDIAGMSTLPGLIMGTAEYMSPQQAAGKPVDFHSDQFSLASVFYEMLTGKRAFHRETIPQILAAIIEDQPAPITASNPAVPARLEAAITRCLAKSPEARYASTADLAMELKAIRDDFLSGRLPPLPPKVSSVAGRWRAAIGLMLLLLIIAGAVVFAARLKSSLVARLGLSILPAEKQLAVLPFTNVGNDPVNQPFCDGLVEILTSKLSQLEQFQKALRVVPVSEVRHEGVLSARDARRVFGVTLVVSGSIQRSDDRVRMTINLTDAVALRQLKAQTIDTEARDVAILQDGVVLELAGMLEVDLPPEAKQVLAAGGTAVPGAYDLYMQGRGYLQNYQAKAENVESAIELFNRALEQDPRYALAHAGLGEAYWRRYESTKEAQWADRARRSCSTALALNGRLAQVHVILAMIDTNTGRHEEAIGAARRAIDLDPLNSDAYRELARAYEARGDLKEAEATFARNVSLRPGYWGSYNELGRFYFRFGRYAEAEKQFRQVVQLVPDIANGYNNLGAIYYTQQRYEEAAEMFEKSLSLRPGDSAHYSNLGTVYFYLGRYAESARTYERALKVNDRDYRRWLNLAAAYQWAPGEREKARAAFQRAAELGEEERAVNPHNPSLLVRLADCYSMLAQTNRARQLAGQALSFAPKDVSVLFQAAVVYEQLGDRTLALECLGSALRQGYSRDLVERSPSLAQLRTDPRYQGMRIP